MKTPSNASATANQTKLQANGDVHAFQQKQDRERTQYLEEAGYRVLRFANLTILQQTEAVLETILATCDEPPP